MCGMIAGVQSFRARTVSLLQGPLAAVASAPRRTPARSRVLADDDLNGSDDGAPATPQATGVGSWGVVTSGRRPIGKFQQKSPRRISPPGLCMIFAMMIFSR
jgi:hypothetical protein